MGSEEALIQPTVGITYASVGDTTAEAMIRNAGIAMNRAATRGGGGYEVFDSAMRERVDSRRTLEVALRHGIERGELELYYQPVVEVRSGVVKGFEALVRWHHPELGLLFPGSFIPLAEDCGLIIPLGEQLMAQACEQLAAWQRDFPTLDPTLSVNLSGVQLARADLAETVRAALTSSGTDARGLHLELTETVLLDDVEAAATTLDGLKALGVGLALDDFGTGYSSLKYLCRFPIDVLKVDQSFVSQLGTGTRDAAMVSMVVGMAEALSMEVVAEGIETTEQLEALRGLDCRYAQGFLFSEARPAHEAERLLPKGGRTPLRRRRRRAALQGALDRRATRRRRRGCGATCATVQHVVVALGADGAGPGTSSATPLLPLAANTIATPGCACRCIGSARRSTRDSVPVVGTSPGSTVRRYHPQRPESIMAAAMSLRPEWRASL